MRRALILIAGGLFGCVNAWAGANCEHSASWQCGSHLGGSTQGSQTGGGLSTTGHTPDPGTTNPHLGSVDTGGSQPPVQVVPAQLIPPQAPEQKVPTALPPEKVKEPPQLPQGQPQLVVTPSQPPQQKVPTALPPEKVKEPPQLPQGQPQLVVTPSQPPEQKVPTALPPEKVKEPPQLPQGVPQLATPHPADVHRPPAATGTPPTGTVAGTVSQLPAGGTVAGKSKPHGHKTVELPHNPTATTTKPQVVATPGRPTPVVTGSQVAEGHTHHLVPTAPNTQFPHGVGASVWLDEVIEPGIENHKVELYRSNDAQEVLYKDAIPMDKTGFHLQVVGTRPPNYH